MTQQKKNTLSSFTAFLRRSKKTILIMVLVIIATLIVSGTVSILLDDHSNLNFPSIGYVHTIGVKAYWDWTLKNQTKQLQWGTIYTGSRDNITLFLQSTSNVQTFLTLTVANWTFRNSHNALAQELANESHYMNLTWNYSNQTLNPGNFFPVTFTLRTSSELTFIKYLINNDVTQFSMDILIQANEN